MEIDWNHPAKTVRGVREALGLSASEFAQRVGLGPHGGRTVRAWEAGKYEPRRNSKVSIEYAAGTYKSKEPTIEMPEDVIVKIRDHLDGLLEQMQKLQAMRRDGTA